MNKRLWIFSSLISLPAIALCIVGCWFEAFEVPKLVAIEKNVASRAYREYAAELWKNPGSAEFAGPREKGWRQIGRVGKNGRKQKALPWGHVRKDSHELVWVGEELVSGIFVEPIETFDFARFFAWAIPAILVLFVGLTLLCIRFFIRYAKERDDFMAATAHDLKTPLVAMRRLIGRDDAEARNLAERLIRLVQNLTDFLCLGGTRPKPTISTFKLADAYRAAYALFKDDFESLGDHPGVAFDGEMSLELRSDETRLVQIFWNLLANELKYAAPFGSVSVRVETAGDFVRVRFADTGKGLSARERRRIFRRYYRAKSLMSCGKGGFGIGLSTAREFARELGGDLTVEANRPSGCVFTLTVRRALS